MPIDPETFDELTNQAEADHYARLDLFSMAPVEQDSADDAMDLSLLGIHVPDEDESGALGDSGIDLSGLGLGRLREAGMGAGSFNTAPPGQHGNDQLSGKLASAKQVDQSLISLITAIQQALTANQSLLAGSSQAGVIDVANAAISDLQSAQATLENSFWNGTNFTSFQGSTDSWNGMDAASSAATAKIQQYQGLPAKLSQAIGQAKSDAAAAAKSASDAQAALNAQAAASAKAQNDATNLVNAAILDAQGLDQAGNFDGAVAALSDPGVATAANTAGLTQQLAAAVRQIGADRAAAAKAANDAATAKAAADAAAQAASANAAAQAQAQATTQQGQFDLQKFMAQLAADQQSHAADAAASSEQFKEQMAAEASARADQMQQLQLILTAAPLLGHDEAAAAFEASLGLTPDNAQAAAGQAGAGSLLDGMGQDQATGDVGVPIQGDAFPVETEF